MGDNTILDERSPLLPDRYPQQDFFVCDVFDAAPKGDMASMEHPLFSISTKPDMKAREYRSGNGATFVRVSPGELGLATVHDRDVLIYCISQLMAAINDDKPISQVVRFKAYDLLVATNRGTDGRGYEQLRGAFKRLQGTQVETNILTDGTEELEIFSLIDKVKIVCETREGRMQEVEVKLSDWVFNAIRAKEVLTLNRHYFRLRKPLERRLYEIARKHCGWPGKPVTFDLSTLQNKCGSKSTDFEFRRLIRTITDQDRQHSHFPDYAITFDDQKDQVTFSPRRKAVEAGNDGERPVISDRGREGGRRAAPGYDIYALEGDFLAYWANKGGQTLKNPDAAFIGFCKARAKREPLR
jgi:plasmid replication initiation protein